MPPVEAGEFGQVVDIDPPQDTIEVKFQDRLRRLDLRKWPAIRPAATISIREARSLFAEANLVVDMTNPRRVWTSLLLTATRHKNAQMYIDPTVAGSPSELIEAARRSLPGFYRTSELGARIRRPNSGR
jgi:hypothetical protein